MALPQTILPHRLPTRPSIVAVSGPRLDTHNSAVNQDAVSLHECGMTHLASGRVCRLPERHPGGCRFA